MDKTEQIEKFKKYEAEFKQYLLDKYFSDKTIDGGDIYDLKVDIDGETIKASRTPPYQSYLDSNIFDVMKGTEYLKRTSGAGIPGDGTRTQCLRRTPAASTPGAGSRTEFLRRSLAVGIGSRMFRPTPAAGTSSSKGPGTLTLRGVGTTASKDAGTSTSKGKGISKNN